MLSNCDVKKKRSNLAVRGCLHTKVGLCAIESLQQSVKKRKLGNESDQKDIESIIKIIDTADRQMYECMILSQNSICKDICNCYAKQQYSLLNDSINLKEDPRNIEEISKSIMNEEIITMAIDLVRDRQSDSKYSVHHFVYVTPPCVQC